MAHLAGGYKRTQVSGLLEHNARTDATRPHEHSNRDIDPARTKYNYELHDREGRTAYEQYKQRMSEVHCMQRDNINVLESLTVTLPKNIPAKDERKFFQSVYEFACKDFGRENIVNATVHKDETSPHIHIGFVPVIHGKRRNGEECEKVNHKKLINKPYLNSFHQRLSFHVAHDLGYMPAVLNGATDNGNKTINELKATRAEDRAEIAKQTAQQAEQVAQIARDDAESQREMAEYMKQSYENLVSETVKLKNKHDKIANDMAAQQAGERSRRRSGAVLHRLTGDTPAGQRVADKRREMRIRGTSPETLRRRIAIESEIQTIPKEKEQVREKNRNTERNDD